MSPGVDNFPRVRKLSKKQLKMFSKLSKLDKKLQTLFTDEVLGNSRQNSLQYIVSIIALLEQLRIKRYARSRVAENQMLEIPKFACFDFRTPSRTSGRFKRQ